MSITDLKVKDLRNIVRAELDLSTETNVIVGDNASGKTSLLEAIYFLCLSKSFRGSRPEELIRTGQDKFQVVARHQINRYNVSNIFGIERDRKQSKIRYAGQPIRKTADLVKNQPVVIITPDCHHLITGGPSKRRSLIDWIMFHVEHGYYKHWQRFSKSLKQRNVLLRKKIYGKELSVWDERLIKSACVLNEQREKLIFLMLDKLRNIMTEIQDLPIEFNYETGWGEGEYASTLEKTRQRDFACGYTSKGPHRADLLIQTEGKMATSVLSRGQTKLLSIAIEIAKTRLIAEVAEKQAIILVDDLAAELDQERKLLIEAMLCSTQSQQIVTTTDINQLPEKYRKKSKMFHVEHGNFTEVLY